MTDSRRLLSKSEWREGVELRASTARGSRLLAPAAERARSTHRESWRSRLTKEYPSDRISSDDLMTNIARFPSDAKSSA